MKSLLRMASVLTALVMASALTLPASAKSVGKTQVTWWGHAAWVITTPAGTRIAIDPWLTNPKAPKMPWPDKLDLILVSHGHFDHVGNTIELAKKTGAQVIGCFELLSLLGVQNANGGNVGGTIKYKDVTIHLVEAVHSSGYSPDGKSPPQYGGAPLGFVIEIKDGPTIYHAGDTALFTDMAMISSLYKPDIAMLPIGGHFTMDPEQAAVAAALMNVKTVVPMHFGTFPVLTGTPAELQAALREHAPGSTVLEFQPGETKNL